MKGQRNQSISKRSAILLSACIAIGGTSRASLGQFTSQSITFNEPWPSVINSNSTPVNDPFNPTVSLQYFSSGAPAIIGSGTGIFAPLADPNDPAFYGQYSSAFTTFGFANPSFTVNLGGGTFPVNNLNMQVSLHSDSGNLGNDIFSASIQGTNNFGQSISMNVPMNLNSGVATQTISFSPPSDFATVSNVSFGLFNNVDPLNPAHTGEFRVDNISFNENLGGPGGGGSGSASTLTASPPNGGTLVFPATRVGATSFEPFTLTNSPSGAPTAYFFSRGLGNENVFGNPNSSGTLQPGQSVTAEFPFTPDAPGTYVSSATASAGNGLSSTPISTVTLLGTTTGPDGVIINDNLNGEVTTPINGNITIPITLINNAPNVGNPISLDGLTVSSFQLQGDANLNGFSPNFVLAPGQLQNYTLTFFAAPGTSGRQSVTLIFNTDEGGAFGDATHPLGTTFFFDTPVSVPVNSTAPLQLLGGNTTAGGISAVINSSTGGSVSATYSVDQSLPAGLPGTFFVPSTGGLEVWDVTFSGTLDNGEAELTFTYDPTLFASNFNFSSLVIYHIVNGSPVMITPTDVDQTDHTITFLTPSFSPFVLGAAVPEPTTAIGLLAFAPLLLRRRRRTCTI